MKIARPANRLRVTRYFFFCPSEGVKGYYAASVWVDAGRSPEVFGQISALTINEGDFIEAEFVYSVIPGRRSQSLVAINVENNEQ